jgi:poly(A) polymerase
LADWWEDFQHASDDERDEMIEAQRRQPSPKAEGEAPAKKRRRRRKPAAGGDAAPAAE